MYEAFKKNIAHLNYDASHDKLTGLYNRAGFDVLRESVELETTAVLMVDADNFKDINDCYGHDTGDKVLRKIADILRHTFRSEDYICRIGGDEFVIFMVHVSPDLRHLIESKAKYINEQLAVTNDHLPEISVSIGVAFGKNAPSGEEVVKFADKALYHRKENGRKGCSFYEPAEEA